MARRHLVTVWNPAFGPDVMEMHLRVLLDLAEACRKGDCTADDIYVWWAKLRSPNRLQPLPHLGDVLKVGSEEPGGAADTETRLYVTDYRALYVAHVAEVTADDPRSVPAERPHVPAYYQRDGVQADCWFRLWDIRRLVGDDTVSVVHELQKLRNVRYHDKPVSIYGGMVELPLIVTEVEQSRFFDQDYTAHLTDQRLWAEFDAQRRGIRSVERDLRENLFGDEVWLSFDPAVRGFVATAEDVFRGHADDPAFDLSSVVVELAKALEVMCARLLRPVLSRAPKDVLAHLNSEELPEAWGPHPPSLAGYARIIAGSKVVAVWLSRHLSDGAWIVDSLPPILEAFARVRNPAAHERRADRAEVARWRRELLGIGCEGVLVRLSKVRAAPR